MISDLALLLVVFRMTARQAWQGKVNVHRNIRLTIYKEEEAGGSTNSRAVSQLTADDLSILHTPTVVTDGAPLSVGVDLHPALPRVVATHQANVTLTCASNRLHALMTPVKGEGITDGRHCTRVGF